LSSSCRVSLASSFSQKKGQHL